MDTNFCEDIWRTGCFRKNPYIIQQLRIIIQPETECISTTTQTRVLRDGWSGVWVPADGGSFSLHHLVQTSAGALPTSYPMGTGSSFLGGKVAGAWSWPLTFIYCRGQRMRGTISPLHQYALRAWYSFKKQRITYVYVYSEEGAAPLCCLWASRTHIEHILA
jgi:hypothetical protein